MTREDPWGDAVNGRPDPNPMPAADDTPEPREETKYDRIGQAISLTVFFIAIILILLLAASLGLLKLFGVI